MNKDPSTTGFIQFNGDPTGAQYARHENGGGLVEKTARVAASAFIAETALVKSLATIAEDVSVSHHTVVAEGATIGARTWVGRRTIVESSATVGADCIVMDHCYIGESTTVGDHSRLDSGVMLHVDESEEYQAHTTLRVSFDVGDLQDPFM